MNNECVQVLILFWLQPPTPQALLNNKYHSQPLWNLSNIKLFKNLTPIPQEFVEDLIFSCR